MDRLQNATSHNRYMGRHLPNVYLRKVLQYRRRENPEEDYQSSALHEGSVIVWRLQMIANTSPRGADDLPWKWLTASAYENVKAAILL